MIIRRIDMSESLVNFLSKEIERVQSLIPLYLSDPSRRFAAGGMKRDIKIARKSIVEWDIPAMISICQDLKGYKEE